MSLVTHDVLAFAVAGEAVRQIRSGHAPWPDVFSADVHASTSRAWPVPDFVIHDNENGHTAAAEFKPPNQTKREYLTGLGQAIAYTRDFYYGLLVVPAIAQDDYRIADHILDVLSQGVTEAVPVGILVYDPRVFGRVTPTFSVMRALQPRAGGPQQRVSVDRSFWAKWREMSPEELGLLLEHLYFEGRTAGEGSVRDRAFVRLWADMVAGRTHHWGGGVRVVSLDTIQNRDAWAKNYRNFIFHLGWSFVDGKLTDAGLEAFRIVHQYGPHSQVFLDHLAKHLLLPGKHLVLLNSIYEFQNARVRSKGPFPDQEQLFLAEVEEHLEDEGYLKRNPGRAGAARRNVPRGFLKAEKQLWRNLGLIIPHGRGGGRAYHPTRGFIFDWTRITSLLASG